MGYNELKEESIEENLQDFEDWFNYDLLSQEEREKIAEQIKNNCNSWYLNWNRQWFLSVTKIKV